MQVHASRSDVLAEIARRETDIGEAREQLRRHEMDLTDIGGLRPAPRQIAMFHKRPGMGITLDAMAGDQADRKLRRLTEPVRCIGAHPDDVTAKNPAGRCGIVGGVSVQCGTKVTRVDGQVPASCIQLSRGNAADLRS